MEWTLARDIFGTYTWSLDLPHKWTARVQDDSEAYTPPEQRPFVISAVCSSRTIGSTETFTDLGLAKVAARTLALSQVHADNVPHVLDDEEHQEQYQALLREQEENWQKFLVTKSDSAGTNL